MAQLPQCLDQQRLHFIGGLERPVGGVRQVEDALQAGQQLRLLAQLLDDLGFLGGELGSRKRWFHPHLIGVSG